jgi:hypothetical protein
MSSKQRPILATRQDPPVSDPRLLRRVGAPGGFEVCGRIRSDLKPYPGKPVEIVLAPLPRRDRTAVNKQNNPAVPAQ